MRVLCTHVQNTQGSGSAAHDRSEPEPVACHTGERHAPSGRWTGRGRRPASAWAASPTRRSSVPTQRWHRPCGARAWRRTCTHVRVHAHRSGIGASSSKAFRLLRASSCCAPACAPCHSPLLPRGALLLLLPAPAAHPFARSRTRALRRSRPASSWSSLCVRQQVGKVWQTITMGRLRRAGGRRCEQRRGSKAILIAARTCDFPRARANARTQARACVQKRKGRTHARNCTLVTTSNSWRVSSCLRPGGMLASTLSCRSSPQCAIHCGTAGGRRVK